MNNLRRVGIVLATALVVGSACMLTACHHGKTSKTSQTTKPYIGSIKISVSATGTVLPYNRLELKAPIAGRVEQMLVEEGDHVTRGQTVAWMSSSERAALLDAARAEGQKTYQSWVDVYKPAPVISPIDGTVIVRSVLPGQTVSSADDIYVISDRLIVQAQVDETDIGKVRVGQTADLSLDAYPDIKVTARVDHIEYESTTVSNVTIYKVDLVPEHVPPQFRSGMSANADIVMAAKKNVLLIPKEALHQSDGKSYVAVYQGPKAKAKLQEVQVGLTNDKQVEILSGVTSEDTLSVETADLSLLKSVDSGTVNPFMPSRPKKSMGGPPPN